MKRVVIITGVSASGKTTLQEELLKRGWVRPINFTTRKMRGEQELDEYVFLDKNQFLTKFGNGDFLEVSQYGGKFYGVSNYLPDSDKICIILDPSGRAQALNILTKKGYVVDTYYVDIPKELQEERLLKRGDSPEQVYLRKLDYEWFSYTPKCIRLNGAKDTEELADIIENKYEV